MPSFSERRAEAIVAMAAMLNDDHPLIGAIDLEAIEQQIAELHEAFPPGTGNSVLHTVAAKAVPLRSLLKVYAEAGMGCEAASRGELEVAASVGFPSNRIVFDSPTKSVSDLRRALELGVSINVDNFGELERLAELHGERAGIARHDEVSPQTSPTQHLGVRINPQTGAGAIGPMSTATLTSKFGIGLKDPGVQQQLLEAYARHPWLNQVHVHSGSQGLSLQHAAEGVAAIVELAQRINEHVGRRQVDRIDIGGGLSVNFDDDRISPSYADYSAALRERVPALHDFHVLTEFGHSLAAKAGTMVSRVESVKTVGGKRIANGWAGVQVATRTIFMPEAWPLRVFACTPDGRPKEGPAALHDIAGPACFAGDVIAHDRMLPELEPGDLVVIPDTGAYAFSNHYSYNLFPRIPVYSYRRAESGRLQWWLIREGQSVQDLIEESGPIDAAPIA